MGQESGMASPNQDRSLHKVSVNVLIEAIHFNESPIMLKCVALGSIQLHMVIVLETFQNRPNNPTIP